MSNNAATPYPGWEPGDALQAYDGRTWDVVEYIRTETQAQAADYVIGAYSCFRVTDEKQRYVKLAREAPEPIYVQVTEQRPGYSLRVLYVVRVDNCIDGDYAAQLVRDDEERSMMRDRDAQHFIDYEVVILRTLDAVLNP